MKKLYLLGILVLVLIVIASFIFYKTAKPGNDCFILPLEEAAEKAAIQLYNSKKEEGMSFSSQCLGIVKVCDIGFAVDIVHVPRSEEDNLVENQCKEFREGKVDRFIELDKDSNIIRII